jgi:hypothetical protein
MTDSGKKESPYKTYSRILEGRQSLRIPITMTLQVKVEGKITNMFFDTRVVNFSTSGICIEGTFCSECYGYTAGDIDPACVLAPYNGNRESSNELYFSMKHPDLDEPLTFCGKAVYCYKQGKDEKIGIVFSSISRDTLRTIQKLINKSGKMPW